MIHIAYQNHHIQPGIYMGLRTVNEPIPVGERAFMIASDIKAAEDGDVPVKVKNFGGKE